MIRRLPAPRPARPAVPVPQPQLLAINPEPSANALCYQPVQITARPPIISPLSPERYRLQVTLDRETHDRLREAQDLLRHVSRHADIAMVLNRALTLLLQDLRRKKCGATDRPRRTSAAARTSRYVPAAVRREVWTRDEGRCAFIGAGGRCTERALLEYHHVIPFANRGPTTAANLQLRCCAHNLHEAREQFADVEPAAVSLFR